MLLKVLDTLECPKCNQTSRLWKLQGEVTETRITNGKVTCPDDHSWQVVEEVLRLDVENSEEEMIFLDHPRTGFPKEVKENERFEFLTVIQDIVKGIDIDSETVIKVRGESILFFKYMKAYDNKFVVVHQNEGILRQLQETAARKQMYNQMSFVRAVNLNLIGEVNSINLFTEPDSDTVSIILGLSEKGELKWEGSETALRIIKS